MDTMIVEQLCPAFFTADLTFGTASFICLAVAVVLGFFDCCSGGVLYRAMKRSIFTIPITLISAVLMIFTLQQPPTQQLLTFTEAQILINTYAKDRAQAQRLQLENKAHGVIPAGDTEQGRLMAQNGKELIESFAKEYNADFKKNIYTRINSEFTLRDGSLSITLSIALALCFIVSLLLIPRFLSGSSKGNTSTTSSQTEKCRFSFKQFFCTAVPLVFVFGQIFLIEQATDRYLSARNCQIHLDANQQTVEIDAKNQDNKGNHQY